MEMFARIALESCRRFGLRPEALCMHPQLEDQLDQLQSKNSSLSGPRSFYEYPKVFVAIP